MEVSQQHLDIFQGIIDTYVNTTEFPIKDLWRQIDNNSLWLRLVGQVNVIGSASGNNRFISRQDLQQQLNFNALDALNDYDLQYVINHAIRAAGVRYASANLEKCGKSKALVHNYRFIASYHNGMKGMMDEIANYKGDTAELERILFLTEHFKFIKNKSARDFLMSLGMNTKNIAIDIRIQNIFSHLGLKLPDASKLNNKKIYEDAENEIINKICTPLKIAPVYFDRILFQNYTEIIQFIK
jgi:hypothetical protein